MPRNLSLSNGRLLVNFDHQYYLRDLYWPHVGQENHTAGHPFRFGLFVDGSFSWMDDPGWEKEICYAEDTLASHVTMRNRDLHITLVCRDTVDFHEDLFLRLVEVHDDRSGTQPDTGPREVRLFFCQDFHIYGIDLGDTAYYEPERHAVFHYKGERWFMIDTAQFARDTYAYVWPRDGSLAAGALIKAGYSHAPEQFFDFCHSAITPEGAMPHSSTRCRSMWPSAVNYMSVFIICTMHSLDRPPAGDC